MLRSSLTVYGYLPQSHGPVTAQARPETGGRGEFGFTSGAPAGAKTASSSARLAPSSGVPMAAGTPATAALGSSSAFRPAEAPGSTGSSGITARRRPGLRPRTSV